MDNRIGVVSVTYLDHARLLLAQPLYNGSAREKKTSEKYSLHSISIGTSAASTRTMTEAAVAKEAGNAAFKSGTILPKVFSGVCGVFLFCNKRNKAVHGRARPYLLLYNTTYQMNSC